MKHHIGKVRCSHTQSHMCFSVKCTSYYWSQLSWYENHLVFLCPVEHIAAAAAALLPLSWRESYSMSIPRSDIENCRRCSASPNVIVYPSIYQGIIGQGAVYVA